MIAPARHAAFEVLRAVEDERADLPAALAQANARLDDPRDRALVSEIATGTLRWQAALDHVAAQFATRPLERLDAAVRTILRLSVYQLLYLDRVPAPAVVNDAVSLAGIARKTSAGGLINAVLRRVGEVRHFPPLPPRPTGVPPAREGALDYLAVACSHPRWLVARWLDRYGFEAAESWVRFNNQPAPLTLRVNRLRLTREALISELAAVGVTAAPCRYAADGLVVESGNPLQTRLAESGVFLVQDEASQLIASLVPAGRGGNGLDACAAPGGKTTALAAAMPGGGRVVAVDLRARRVRLLRKTVERSGARHINVVRADLTKDVPFRAVFDWALVDAPCSGLGTLRRDPDIRWRRAAADLPRFAEVQLSLLAAVSAAVRPGGVLVYSTCSSEPEENDEVVQRFLADQGEYMRLDLRQAGWVPDRVAGLLDGSGCLRTRPDVHGLEAFFGAALVRQPAVAGSALERRGNL